MPRMENFDLFARPVEAKRPLSVSELNERAASLLERDLGRIDVEGEISGFMAHRSGHWYFTLKDAQGQVSCCCFKGNQRGITAKPQDGMQVVVRGRLTVYSPRGSYQLVAEHVRPAGAGALLAKLEALKQKLLAEGLFAPERKRPLPMFVRRIALVTSPDGAAVRDFLRVATERHAGVSVLVFPTLVQGPGAAAAIAQAVRLASERADRYGLDLIVLTRGGGSSEDLGAFNDELVVRALADCVVPTVSAVGHEIDTTLSDLVADFRAPTPTAAAQRVVQDMAAVHAALGQRLRELVRLLRMQIGERRRRVHEGQIALRDPLRRLLRARQRIDLAAQALERSLAEHIGRERERLRALSVRLERAHPQALLVERSRRLEGVAERLPRAAQKILERRRERLARLAATLDALSPLAVLQRGYAIALTEPDQRAVRRATDVALGATLRVRLAQGALTVTVMKKEEDGS